MMGCVDVMMQKLMDKQGIFVVVGWVFVFDGGGDDFFWIWLLEFF